MFTYVLLAAVLFILVLEGLWRWVLKKPVKPFTVRDCVCVITGGSSGLGLELARQLLEQGAKNVILIARDEKRLMSAKKELRSDDKVIIQSADVCSYSSLKAAAEDIGEVDYLFCCAGASEPGFFLEQEPEAFARGINLNYLGSVYTCKAFAKNMLKRGGKIVLVSSTVGLMGLVGYAQYSPTKFAIRGLAECLRGELRPMGIDVHVYYVGTIDTPGYAQENLKKPMITKQLEGTECSDSSPKARVNTLLKGLEKGEFAICSDFLTRAIKEVHGLSRPNHGIVISMLLGFFSPIAGIVWTCYSDYLIGKGTAK